MDRKPLKIQKSLRVRETQQPAINLNQLFIASFSHTRRTFPQFLVHIIST